MRRIHCNPLGFVFLTVALLTTAAVAQTQLTYITNNGTLTITGYTGSVPGVLNIPNTIGALPVISVGSNAFAEDRSLTNVTLALGIATVESNAFGGCTSLANASIPESVTSIGSVAFGGCALTNVTVSATVTNLGQVPFLNCPLAAIDVATNNPYYASVGGVLFSNDLGTLLEFPHNYPTNQYTVPNTVTTIAPRAFEGCSLSGGITMDTNLTNIGTMAFFDCALSLAGIRTVVIPASVTTIGDEAFTSTGTKTYYFLGNAPGGSTNAFYDAGLVAYFLAGTTGWGDVPDGYGGTFEGIQLGEVNGAVTNSVSGSNLTLSGFGGALNATYYILSSTNASLPVSQWTPIQTNALGGGYFSFTVTNAIDPTLPQQF